MYRPPRLRHVTSHMTTAEFNLENVTQEIENWILNYLDRPSDHYNGNKPCPFAAKAWFDKAMSSLVTAT